MTSQLPNQLQAIEIESVNSRLGAFSKVRVDASSGGSVSIEVIAGVPVVALQHEIASTIRAACAQEGAVVAGVAIRQRIDAHAPQGSTAPLASVRNIIAVGSGKGGVGKSTVAVNLAVALAREGARVGILDADIYGPSVPTMLGITGRPDSPDGKSIEPLRAHGIQAMSIGLLVEQETPMIWRGPMATSALTQLLNDSRWDDLDYLIVDLPPGTGDIQLTLAQKIPVAGAVVVTTPQDVATLDARKALRMFEKVEVPILGLVENMALHVCSNCGQAEHIFGEGGGARLAAQYGYPLLGSLPLERAIRERGDAGAPIVVSEPESPSAQAFVAMARRVALELAKRPVVARPLSIQLAND
ncbi:iron-sulfur cluster carrier protein ApbC [Cognatilysobacter lacus]|uniref:Iron-sulfur cluster carrier protein n=1 Tax=Cognatilysobacter lacus TaxID=1643323 RepID=A0A5D8Z7R5_9GAMM|nr:iron-sulfur cluster carrier protein ApbC [Lysobacter lacus]TZF90162.1 iron-sulfur cluster carrier protein ApbC [Lysobacter lacus]